MIKELFKKYCLKITPVFILSLLIIPITNVTYCYATTKIEDVEIVPGGNSIGLRISTDGVLVVGYTDNEDTSMNNRILVGDIIKKFNNQQVLNSRDLIKKVQNSEKDVVTLTILRESAEVKKEIKLAKNNEGNYVLGLWIRDSAAGIGTLTFYDPKTNSFGALGHPISDGNTNKNIIIKKGDLLEASIISIKKGEKGDPGEIRGIFSNDKNIIGNIEENTNCGVFGKYEDDFRNNCNKDTLKVAARNQIKLGAAKIITTIDEEGPKEYQIEIVKLYEQDKADSKSMMIRITDPVLLEKTGGIIQGMSGSPIIQNNKIVGAVTHVLINKPDTGYGIYIDWMLEEAGIIQ